VGGEEFAMCERLAKDCRAPELFARPMEAHNDPAYARSIGKHYPQIGEAAKIKLTRLDKQSLVETACQVHKEPATL
jgi:hypothetical protein